MIESSFAVPWSRNAGAPDHVNTSHSVAYPLSFVQRPMNPEIKPKICCFPLNLPKMGLDHSLESYIFPYDDAMIDDNGNVHPRSETLEALMETLSNHSDGYFRSQAFKRLKQQEVEV